MAYQIKNFSSWKNQRMNEGIVDTIKNVGKKLLGLLSKFPGLSWVGDKFEGVGSWTMNMALSQKKGEVPRGIEYYPYTETETIVNAALSEEGITPKKQPIERETVTESLMNEARGTKDNHPDSNVPNVDYKELEEQLELRLNARTMGGETQFSPIIIWGGVGIGKTAAVKTLAKKYKMDHMIVNLSQVDQDVMLLPGEEKESGMGRVIPAKWLPVFNSEAKDAAKKEAEKNGPIDPATGRPRGGILFLDELTRASTEAILNAMLSLIHDRKVLNWSLPSAWVIVAAANREQDDWTRFRKAAAMYNRFGHVNLVPTVAAFKKFAEEYIDKETGEMIIDPLMLDFLEFNDELLHDFDPKNRNITVFPTPRTWEMGATSMYTLKKVMNAMNPPQKPTMKQLENILAQNVGIAAARQYFAFLKLVKEMDVKSLKMVYTSPEKAALPTKEGQEYKTDSACATIASIIMDRKGEKLTPEEIKNVVDYIVRLDHPKWGVMMAKKFIETHPYIHHKLPQYDPKYRDAFTYMIQKFDETYPNYDPDNPYTDEYSGEE